MQADTQVLIVGGSLNGLTAAMLLAQQGVRVVVVERHPSTTVQYKFAGVSPRSMEIFREAGIEAEVRAHRTGDQKGAEIASARNLADPEPRFMGKPWAGAETLSAVTAETCDQDRLEPILRGAAEVCGADVRFNTELVGFEQDAAGVAGRVRDLATGAESVVRAAYLVAADGIGGRTREALGIGRHGPGVLQHWMNLIFDTDLQPYIGGRRFTSCFVTDVNGSFTPRQDRWLLALQYDPRQGERPEDFDAEKTRALVRQGAGREDVKAELFDARPWDVAALVADRFREGRAFLLGDAAHVMPPTGGFGGYTGIHDAHNLAWKLAAVLKGQAAPKLLDSYDAERRPIAQGTLAQALARLSAWFKDPTKALPPPEPILEDFHVIFGQAYPSGALVGETVQSGPPFEDPRRPSGRPGVRAAHLALERNGERIGLHDLVQRRFLLLIGPRGGAWQPALQSIRARSAAPLQSADLGAGLTDLERRFEDAFHAGPDGAVLIRPDGVIAWRCAHAPADPAAALSSVLDQLGVRMAAPAGAGRA